MSKVTELHKYPAVQLRAMLQNREIRPTELVEHYLRRIEALNPKLHALTTLTGDMALWRAGELEAAGAVPDRFEQPIWGLPFADKDLDDREGVRSTYGSVAMTGYVAQSSSPVVQDMDRAGGISLGKTNVPEFGSPCYAVNKLPEGYARNPWDPSLDPGGSSSGAAVAVSARMLPFAPGNDAGGSIRIPASATGLVGLKPSRGRVPGLPGSGSLAGLPTAGPIGRTVDDVALLLDGMLKGPQRYAVRAPQPPYMSENGSFLDAANLPIPRLRIGWNTWSPWNEEYDIVVDSQVMRVFQETLDLLKNLGHRVEEVEPTPAPGYVQAFRSVWMGSAASAPLPDEALEVVEPLTAWLIRSGRERPASDLPAGLTRLAEFESQIISDYSDFDAVLTPGLAMTPRASDWYDQVDGNLNFVQQCQYTPFTSYLNVAGLPAIALPVGQGTSEVTGASVPIGVQAIGRPGDEATLLRLGKQLEEVLSWSERVPGIAK
ncbi:amidase [Actinomycetaceae bacterium MB13-C1-2]|nr:amidase [Actinomycetaceae bacterium MB13-C1-2]